ncbi:hypothetical protein HHI36_009603 [Cryptolaemus montrouzieri]|uniref:Mitochondrial ribonuclease P catalytic subunit n=1 Tax=Cryptolaemus montrouzieri TaxID=559131 RepID=A0ABD2MGC3_9CUCU
MSLFQRVLRFRCFHSSTSYLAVNQKKLLERARKDEENEILNRILKNPQIANPNDVEYLRNEVLNSGGKFTTKSVDRILLKYFISSKQYDIGLDYIKYLSEEHISKSHLFLTNQIFRLYFQKRYEEKSLSEAAEEHLISLYKNLRKSYPVLDVISLEHAILALSVTKEWRKTIELVDEIKKMNRPSSICFSAIIAAAFLNNEEKTAWMFFNEMFEKERPPYDVIFQAYFEQLESLPDKQEVLSNLEKLFRICTEKDIIFSERVILDLNKLLRKNDIYATFTTINKRGYCTNCQKQLTNLELTDEVFEKLKGKIVNNVIVGKNIFSKTTPEEFSRFQTFLKSFDSCDVIIDGLNVAYTAGTKQSAAVYSTLLAHVVAHFVNKEKTVVVLGRAHMNKWPKKQWSYVRNNAKIFLTQDISQDDPYLLCCALHCGKDTIIVTKDLMRSHLFLLKDPVDKIMFSRWLSQRQYQLKFITNDGKVHFKVPLPYTETMQKKLDNWHIPYLSNVDPNHEGNESSTKWLCMQCSK